MKLKKAISGILATAVLASSMMTAVQPALAWDAPQTQWQEASREGVKARFFVGSDLHIGRNNDASKKLTNTLDVFESIDANADGVLFVGDVTDSGSVSQYETLMDIVNGSSFGQDGKVEIAMGNHEYNNASGAMARFEENTGQNANEVIYYDNDGKATGEPGETLAATVVKLSAKNYGGDYTDQYDMVKTALETATAKNPNAPVIVMGHHGIKNTAYVTNEWYGNYGAGTDKDMVALFKHYPQVIHFSGHSHATLEDARSIYQNDGYTAIQDGTIGAYFENEKGKVDPTSGVAATRPADSEISSQALRVDVLDDGTVKIYRMNLTTGDYMYEDEPWTFKSGDASDRPYDENRSSHAPSFDAEAAVSASAADEKTVTVQFPKAAPASAKNNDMIHEYEITLTPQDGSGGAVTRKVFADYYMPTEKDTWDVKITGLEVGTTYDAAVTAVTSFGAKSSAITGEVTTQAAKPYETPQPDVLNIDFRNDSTADANGHEVKTVGAPTKVTDETYGTVYHFDGKDDGFRYAMKAADYEKYKNGFTMETLVKLYSGTNPFSNQESAGCGFELNKDGKTLEFWNKVNGTTIKPSTDISGLKGNWMHLMATFDGYETKLYVNGELKSTVAGEGSMTIPKETARYFYIGGDTNGSGALQNPANCDIALARLYSGAMNDEDVAKTYDATRPTFKVTLSCSDENGTASVNPETAKEGDTVTITTTPNDKENYKAAVTVTKAKGGNVDVIDHKDGSYSFTQPAENVTVHVTFVPCYTPNIPETTGGTVALDPAQPAVGDAVTITATADDGYKVDHIQLTVTDEKLEGSDAQSLRLDDLQPGETVILEADEQGQYHFTQPAYKVEIVPVFAKEDSGSGGGGVAHYVPEITHNDGGTVAVNPTAPAAGQTVTITATPDDGYVVDTVTVTDKGGDDVATTKNSDGTFSFEQPHGKVSIAVTFAKADETWDNPYADVHNGDWFFDPVRYVQQNGLMVGTADGMFSPNATASRGMLVTILWRLAGEPAAENTDTFTDVAADSWYADAVAWASGEGIVGGYGDGRFGANDAITREQLASMFQRYADFCGMDTTARSDLSAFSDGAAVSSWAVEPMAWAVADGLLGGFEDNSLRPQGEATRAQLAAILQRYHEQAMA